ADLHLDGPRVRGAGNEVGDTRLGRIGHIEDGPAAMPEVTRVEVPATVALQNGELEGRPTIDFAVADDADVARDRARGDRGTHLGVGDGRREASDDQNHDDRESS